jgi:hypothetical protein
MDIDPPDDNQLAGADLSALSDVYALMIGAQDAATAAQLQKHRKLLDVTPNATRLAKAGNVAALRLVLERLLPAQRRRTVSIDLPPIKVAGDIPRALAAVTAAVGRGELTPDEGAALGSLIGATRQAIELAEIDARLRRLEEEQ